MDGKLQKNQGEGTFQTKCVLYKTKKVRDMIVKHMIEDKLKASQQLRKLARDATRDLLELAFGVDEEDEHMAPAKTDSEEEAIEMDNEEVHLKDDFLKRTFAGKQ
jgi:hypothetical protein